MSALTDKLKKQARALIPRFYREYKGASDWWYSVRVDGKDYDLNFLTHDPDGTGEFPAKLRNAVKVVAYIDGIDGKFIRLGYFNGRYKMGNRMYKDRRAIEDNPPLLIDRLRRHPWVAGFMKKTLKTSYDNKVHIFKKGSSAYVSRLGDDGYVRLHHIGAGRTIRPDLSNYVPLYIDDLRGYFVPNHEGLDIHENPSPLFKSGGYIVVKTYTGGRQEFTDHIETLAEARKFRKYFLEQNEKSLLYRGRTLFDSVEIFPHTAILRNPPLSSHGSSIRIKRTHGLSLAEMRALYKLVKQGKDTAIEYARKKLEVPRSASKSDLLAVVDHHIRDLADR